MDSRSPRSGGTGRAGWLRRALDAAARGLGAGSRAVGAAARGLGAGSRAVRAGARTAGQRLAPPAARLGARLAPVDRRLRGFLGVVTPTGWAAFGLLLVTAAVGARLGWQEAWSAAAVLLLVVLVAWLWLLPRATYTVTHDLLSRRITVGDLAALHVRVTNPSSRTVLPSRMEMPVGGGRGVFFVPTLRPARTHEVGFTVPTHRRGVVVVGPVVSVARDPVGLLRRERPWTAPVPVHVHPRTVRLDTVLKGALRDVEGAVTQELSSSDVSFHALRDYVPGDDRRNVHWRTTARTGRLVVRQFEETRRANLLVLLSLRPEDYTGAEDFETAVSVACSLALAALADERDVHVRTQAGELPTASATRLLDASCLLATAPGETCDLLVRHACADHPDASVLVVVTGQECEDRLLARTRVLASPDTSTLAVRCGAGPLRRRHLAGMPVVDLDRIDHLATALRTVAS